MAKHKISIEGFEPFEAETGTKLALAIEQAGIDISHRCGGQAKCTTCRIRLDSDQPEMGEKERLALEEDDLLGQCRLACQIRVDRDISAAVLMRASEQGWTPGIELEP